LTAKKHVATTLKTILDHPMVEAIRDRSAYIRPIINDVLSWWNYDLYKRKPGPAYYENGVFHTTDLDLACFLYALLDRRAVINLPFYKSQTPTVLKEDEKVISKDNRHGEIIGVEANQNFFSFSVKVKDLNVVGEEEVGKPRNFMIVGYDGNWSPSWRTIDFVPTMKENRFVTENELWSGNQIYFDNFVAPNRWISLFGHHYAITKMLIDRLKEEASFYRREQKRLLDAGIEFPEGVGPVPYTPGTKIPGVKKKLRAVEFQIQYPEFKDEYKPVGDTQHGLLQAYTHQKNLGNAARRLNFAVRATELAHDRSPDRLPAWLKNVKWESGYQIPGKKNKWDRMVLFQPAPGKTGFAILKREFEKTQEVAE
jgi:hypothetical protein